MNNFEKELEGLFNNLQNNLPVTQSCEFNFSEIKKSIYKKFEDAINFLNEKYEYKAIQIIKVNNNFLSLLFNVDKGVGFLIIFGKSKLVLALFEDDNFITFIGRSKNLQNKNIKLLRLNINSQNKNEYKLADNSGMKIDINEVVLQIIRWSLN